MNYFVHQTSAERYAQCRPYFHPFVIERIRRHLNLNGPVPCAVDVACGTGQSALALAEIASEIVATDIASAMLAQAPVHARIRYLEAPAEQLPLESQTVDLMTVSLAFHWFNRSRFLTEAHRLLRTGGWLVIYSNGFFGRMNDNPAFEQWHQESYLTRYPTPLRNNQPLTDEDAHVFGFTFSGREPYTNEITFSARQLAGYLMTQSNVIAAVEQGSQSPQSVHSWLLDSVTPFFRIGTATFLFSGEIWYLQANVRQ
jgi:SAM-dependent methyltransferase